MNVFRLLADMAHLGAIVALLAKIVHSKSCAGISGKSQVLYGLVFITRYLDLFTNFISVYNTVLKIAFILITLTTVWAVYFKFKDTYDRENDTFHAYVLVLISAGLGLFINHESTVMEVLWTLSIYLEAVAILPQLWMIRKTRNADSFTYHYLFLLGSYRALYIANWIYRYNIEGFYDSLAIVAGSVQTILYFDFFYLYCSKVVKGEKFQLAKDGEDEQLIEITD